MHRRPRSFSLCALSALAALGVAVSPASVRADAADAAGNTDSLLMGREAGNTDSLLKGEIHIDETGELSLSSTSSTPEGIGAETTNDVLERIAGEAGAGASSTAAGVELAALGEREDDFDSSGSETAAAAAASALESEASAADEELREIRKHHPHLGEEALAELSDIQHGRGRNAQQPGHGHGRPVTVATRAHGHKGKKRGHGAERRQSAQSARGTQGTAGLLQTGTGVAAGAPSGSTSRE